MACPNKKGGKGTVEKTDGEEESTSNEKDDKSGIILMRRIPNKDIVYLVSNSAQMNFFGLDKFVTPEIDRHIVYDTDLTKSILFADTSYPYEFVDSDNIEDNDFFDLGKKMGVNHFLLKDRVKNGLRLEEVTCREDELNLLYVINTRDSFYFPLFKKGVDRVMKVHPDALSFSLEALPINERLTMENLLPADHPGKDYCSEREDGPCKYILCKNHPATSVNKSGRIIVHHPYISLTDMRYTCISDLGDSTLEEVGRIMNLTRERIRQLEEKGCEKLNGTMNEKEYT
jgi:hypothetical protein